MVWDRDGVGCAVYGGVRGAGGGLERVGGKVYELGFLYVLISLRIEETLILNLHYA